ncbi:hydantoinase/oxoprolinase family protein, partial [Candidatus Poribacteria bacterium]|nr:hydantoinase/oxoprolinase family protein [Candidatus Poribacteria bacterium]
VICGHELTSNLNSLRRAVTVAFNARLVPVIKELLMSVKTVLNNRNIVAPLMVVKGDGHLVSDVVAMEKPIETILSGPAASIMGANYLAGVDSGIVVDMGGTTTDIAILRNGIPKVKADGATVGKWKMSIRAADIRTSGLGGDSHIIMDRDEGVVLSPRRVTPLSLAAHYYSEVVDELKMLGKREWTTYLVQPTDFLVRMKNINHHVLDRNERQIYDALSDRPKSAYTLALELDLMHPALLNTSGLEELGLVGRVGFTPTDILHAEESYTCWNVEAAKIATETYARLLNMETDYFIEFIRNRVTEKISAEILSRFISEDMDEVMAFDCKICSILLGKILGKNIVPELDLKASIKTPIIAIGAPVETYFPSVASQLNAELVIPKHAEVANAVGAITGSIIETVEVLIDPIYTPAGIKCYSVHSPLEKIDFKNLESAYIYAENVARKLVKEKALQAGAGQQVEIRVEKSHQTAKAAEGYGESEFLLAYHVKATAIGKPNIFFD